MGKVFNSKNAINFLKKMGFDDIRLTGETDETIDFQVSYCGEEYYAYASNFTMSAYNTDGVIYPFSRKWQNYMCQVSKNYPELLVGYLKGKIDDDAFLHNERQKLSYSIEAEKRYQEKLQASEERIDNIVAKYNLTKEKNVL